MLKFSISRQQYDALAYTGSCYWRRPNTRISLVSRGLVESGTRKRTPLGDAVYQAVNDAAENEYRYPRNGIKVQVDEATIAKPAVEVLPFTDGPDEPEGYDPTYDPSYDAYLQEQRIIRTAEFIRIGILPEETTVIDTNPLIQLRDRTVQVALDNGLIPTRDVGDPAINQLEAIPHKIGAVLSYMWAHVTDELTADSVSRRPMVGTASFITDANKLLDHIEGLDEVPVVIYGHQYDYHLNSATGEQSYVNRDQNPRRPIGVVLCEVVENTNFDLDESSWHWQYLRNGVFTHSSDTFTGENAGIQAVIALEDTLRALI